MSNIKGFHNRGTFKQGQKPWNAGTRKKKICPECKKEFTLMNNTKQIFCSKGCASANRQRGIKYSIERKIKFSMAKTKEKQFTGFRSTKTHQLKCSPEYKNWRLKVFTRDNFTCQGCHRLGIYLEAHHIKPKRDYPELWFDENNGITLCRECHIKVDKFRGRGKQKNMEGELKSQTQK